MVRNPKDFRWFRYCSFLQFYASGLNLGQVNPAPFSTLKPPNIMLDYFTSAIAIDFEDMLWISKRPIDHSHWRHNLLQNVYIYLELIESEVDFESYDY